MGVSRLTAFIKRKTSKVLVISEPIASGRSTVAQLLAEQFRSGGRGAAVIDLDRVYVMLDDGPAMAYQRISREARRTAAALTDHFVLGFRPLREPVTTVSA